MSETVRTTTGTTAMTVVSMKGITTICLPVGLGVRR